MTQLTEKKTPKPLSRQSIFRERIFRAWNNEACSSSQSRKMEIARKAGTLKRYIFLMKNLVECFAPCVRACIYLGTLLEILDKICRLVERILLLLGCCRVALASFLKRL